MHIECRRWTQRTTGSTYFCTRVHLSPEKTVTLPIEYGCGEHCVSAGIAWLRTNGYTAALAPEIRYRSAVLEALGCTYSIADVGCKSDL